jgi:hypothetical protein
MWCIDGKEEWAKKVVAQGSSIFKGTLYIKKKIIISMEWA